MRAIILYPGDDGYWIAECPSLPGCATQGTSKAEAIANAREAVEAWIETARANGQPVPEERFDTQVVCI